MYQLEIISQILPVSNGTVTWVHDSEPDNAAGLANFNDYLLASGNTRPLAIWTGMFNIMEILTCLCVHC